MLLFGCDIRALSVFMLESLTRFEQIFRKSVLLQKQRYCYALFLGVLYTAHVASLPIFRFLLFRRCQVDENRFVRRRSSTESGIFRLLIRVVDWPVCCVCVVCVYV